MVFLQKKILNNYSILYIELNYIFFLNPKKLMNLTVINNEFL